IDADGRANGTGNSATRRLVEPLGGGGQGLLFPHADHYGTGAREVGFGKTDLHHANLGKIGGRSGERARSARRSSYIVDSRSQHQSPPEAASIHGFCGSWT